MVQEWLLTHMTTLYKSLLHTVTVFTVLLVNVFQKWIFLCFQAQIHAGWWAFHTKSPTLLTPLSQDPFTCLIGSHDIALGQAQQKTELPSVPLLFRDVTAVMEMCSLSHRLATSDVFDDAASHVPLLLVSAFTVTWHLLSHCLITDVYKAIPKQ
jgi:hypothetical protein